MNSLESLKPDLEAERKHLVICIIAREIVERVSQIMQGKQDQQFLSTSLEQRCEQVFARHADNPLFTEFYKQYMMDATKKQTIISSIGFCTQEAILSIQQ